MTRDAEQEWTTATPSKILGRKLFEISLDVWKDSLLKGEISPELCDAFEENGHSLIKPTLQLRHVNGESQWIIVDVRRNETKAYRVRGDGNGFAVHKDNDVGVHVYISNTTLQSARRKSALPPDTRFDALKCRQYAIARKEREQLAVTVIFKPEDMIEEA